MDQIRIVATLLFVLSWGCSPEILVGYATVVTNDLPVAPAQSSPDSDDDDDGGAEPTPTPIATPTPEPIVISGRVVLGAVSDADVAVYVLSDSLAPDLLLGEGVTLEDGRFEVELEIPDGVDFENVALELRASGGTYVDEATGEETVLDPSVPLRTWMPPVSEEGAQEVGISVLTEMAAAAAEARILASGETINQLLILQNIDETALFFEEVWGVDVSLEPNDVLMDVIDPTTDAGKLGLLAAGFSNLAGVYGLGQVELAHAFAADSLDGELDGAAFNSILTVSVSGIDLAYAGSSTDPTEIVRASVDQWLATELNPLSELAIDDVGFTFLAVPVVEITTSLDSGSASFAAWKNQFSSRFENVLTLDPDFTALADQFNGAQMGLFVKDDGIDAITGEAFVYRPGCNPAAFDGEQCGASLSLMRLPVVEFSCGVVDGCTAIFDGEDATVEYEPAAENIPANVPNDTQDTAAGSIACTSGVCTLQQSGRVFGPSGDYTVTVSFSHLGPEDGCGGHSVDGMQCSATHSISAALDAVTIVPAEDCVAFSIQPDCELQQGLPDEIEFIDEDP